MESIVISMLMLLMLSMSGVAAYDLVSDGAGYVLIERHIDAANGMFSSTVKSSGLENENDPSANTYCVIGGLDEDEYRLDAGYFELRLIYKNVDGTEDVLEWTQTSWITESTITGADLSNIEDLYAGDIGVSGFGGLGLSGTYAYLDGSGGHHHGYWYHAVASTTAFGGGIPGHERKVAYSSELWIKTDSTAPTTAGPTASPSTAPSASPSLGPSSAPTNQPSSSPSTSPTMAPSRCDAANMHKANWHNMLNEDDSADDLVRGSSIEFDAATLSLTFWASLEYVGLSADGSWSDEYNLGTTYWIDFQSFAASAEGVHTPGTCGNRRSSDYEGLAFADYWGYTADPLDLATAATSERMAYPPSDWTLGGDAASSCNVVKYERSFSWTEMTACSSAAGEPLIAVTQSEDAVELTGTLFVELVSPYSMSSSGYFRTFPVIQQDFGIVLDRQMDVLASTGVQLFISSVMAYGHIEKEDGSTAYTVTILTQSADYVMLDAATPISAPEGVTVSGISSVANGCLVASSFTCGQIFTATIPAVCSSEDDVIDLSGDYQFGFTPQCRTIDGVEDAACTTFMTTLSSDGKVALDVGALFVDSCSVDLFAVTFTGALSFYTDSAFTAAADASDPFVIGQDTVYGKVTVNIPDNPSGDVYQFVDVSIENVYVCTAASALTVDPDTGLGGCWSNEGVIDKDGPYTVIGSGALAAYQGSTEYGVSGVNEAAFSFLTFDTPRDAIYVHVQLLLTMSTDTGSERRRMLLQSEGSVGAGNAFQSYVDSVAVQQAEEGADGDAGPMSTDGVGAVNGGVMAMVFAVIALFAE